MKKIKHFLKQLLPSLILLGVLGGAAIASAYIYNPTVGGGVSTLNGLSGAVTLTAGTNITLPTLGNNITINSTGGGSQNLSQVLTVGNKTGAQSIISNNTKSFLNVFDAGVTLGGSANGTNIFVNDNSKQISLQVPYQSALNPWIYVDGNAGQQFMGDFAGNGNHLFSKLTDPTDKYEINGQKAVVQTGPTYNPIGAPGLNDFSFISFNGNGSRTYTVTIDGATTFQWSDGFTTVSGVTITGANQTIGTLNDAVIKFGAVLGHTIGDNWVTSFAVSFGRMQVLDGLNRTSCVGDCDATGNSTTISTDDRDQNKNVIINASKLIQLKTKVTERTGGVQDDSVTNVAYGSTTNLIAHDGTYDIEVTSGTGTTTINLPSEASTSVGDTYIISDLDAISSTSRITVDAGAGNSIHASTIAQTFSIATNGQSITIKKVAGKTWKIE